MFNVVGESKLEDVVFAQQRISPRLEAINKLDDMIRSSLMFVVKEERKDIVRQLVDNRFDIDKVSFVNLQKKVKDKLWLLWYKGWELGQQQDVLFSNREDNVAEFALPQKLIDLLTKYNIDPVGLSLDQIADKADAMASEIEPDDYDNLIDLIDEVDPDSLTKGVVEKIAIGESGNKAIKDLNRQVDKVVKKPEQPKQSKIGRATKILEEKAASKAAKKPKVTNAEKIQKIIDNKQKKINSKAADVNARISTLQQKLADGGLSKDEQRKTRRQLRDLNKQQASNILSLGLKKERQLLRAEQEQQGRELKNRQLSQQLDTDYMMMQSDFGRVYLETRLEQIGRKVSDDEKLGLENRMRTVFEIQTGKTNETRKSVIQNYFEKETLFYNVGEKRSLMPFGSGQIPVSTPKNIDETIAGQRFESDVTKPKPNRNMRKLYDQVENAMYGEEYGSPSIAKNILFKNPNATNIKLTEIQKKQLRILSKDNTVDRSVIEKISKRSKQNQDTLATRVGRVVRTELAAANHLGRLTYIALNDKNGLVKWVVDDEHLSRGVVCAEPINTNDRYVATPRVAHGVGCNGRAIGQSVGVGIGLNGIYRTIDVMTIPSLFVPLHPHCLCSIRPLTRDELNKVIAATVAQTGASVTTALGAIGANQLSSDQLANQQIPLQEDNPMSWGVMAVTAGATVLAAGLMYAYYRKVIAKALKDRVTDGIKPSKPSINKGSAKKVIEQGVPKVDAPTPTPDVNVTKQSSTLKQIADVPAQPVIKPPVVDTPNVTNLPDQRPVVDIPDAAEVPQRQPMQELRPKLQIDGLDELEMVRVDDHIQHLTDVEIKAKQWADYDNATPQMQRAIVNIELPQQVNNSYLTDVVGDVLRKDETRVGDLLQEALQKRRSVLELDVLPQPNNREIQDVLKTLRETSKKKNKFKIGNKTTDIIEVSRSLEDAVDDLLKEVKTNKKIGYKDYVSLKKRMATYRQQQDAFDKELRTLLNLPEDSVVAEYIQQVVADAGDDAKQIPSGFVRYLKKRNNVDVVNELLEQQRYATKIKQRGYRSLANPTASSKVDKALIDSTSRGAFLRNVNTKINQLQKGNVKVISKAQVRYLVEQHGDENNLLQSYLASKGSPKLEETQIAEVIKLLQQEQDAIRKAEFRKRFNNAEFSKRFNNAEFSKVNYNYLSFFKQKARITNSCN